MMRFGLHPKSSLLKQKGSISKFGKYTADCYFLTLRRKEEVFWLLEHTPLRHFEKVERKKIVLQNKNTLRWDKLQGEISRLQRQIKEMTEVCTNSAKREMDALSFSVRVKLYEDSRGVLRLAGC